MTAILEEQFGELAATLGEAPGTQIELQTAESRPARTEQLVNTLADLLVQSDTRARELVQAEHGLLQKALGSACDDLAQHLDNFDFAAALQVLRAHQPDHLQ